MLARSMYALTLICALVIGAHAAVPTSVTVQGRLTDAGGSPLPAGTKNFTFKIFDDSLAGTEVWPIGSGEDQVINTDANGLWFAFVGTVIPLTESVFSDTARWLEVNVDGTTLPRIRLSSVPYAHRVGALLSLDIIDEPGASSLVGPNIQLGTYETPILQHSIQTPGSGYVLVIATATVISNHDATLPWGSRSYFNVSTDSHYSSNHGVQIQIPNTAPTGTYFNAVTVHALIPTERGVDDFWFLGQRDLDDVTWAFDPHLTLVYVPTAYGTVSTAASLALPRPQLHPDSATDASADLKALTEATIKAELERLRRQIDDLEDIVSKQNEIPR